MPQAPADQDQKFILTGSKVSDKPAFVRGVDAPSLAPANKFPGMAVVVLILLFMGTAAAAIYWATIIHPRQTSGKTGATTNAPVVSTKPKEKPAPVAPPANDADWMLALGTNDIPDTPAAGRIHGKNFVAERATFQNGSLTLRLGTHGGVEFGAVINFSGAQPEELSGKTVNVTTNAEKAAQVTLRWKDDSATKAQKENFDHGYAMRLEFGALANNRLPGKIYLCTPERPEKLSLGLLQRQRRKPKPKAPNNPPKPQ